MGTSKSLNLHPATFLDQPQETMGSVNIIALLAFVAHAHAEDPVANVQDDSQNEELAANVQDDSQNDDASMDQFADMLMDKLADKLLDSGLVGNDDELDEDDQLDEEQLGEGEDYAVDEADDDELGDDELGSVLGLRGGAAMKAMKAMAAMKAMKKSAAMKAMKAMKVSKIAKGKYKKALVFRGSKEKTSGGLKKSDLIKNANGKIVSKKQSTAAKKRFGSTLKKWTDAVKAARKSLGLKGFVAVKKGTPLYTKAKANYR